jgi:hypothetical protein
MLVVAMLPAHGAGAAGSTPQPPLKPQLSPPGWDTALSTTAKPVTVIANTVKITSTILNGIAPNGAWDLRGNRRRFGGFSGLLVAQGRIYVASDKGWWFGATLEIDGDNGLNVTDGKLAPMRDGAGDRYTKDWGDAEGITRIGDRLVVSFERDDRLMFLGDAGRLGATIQPRNFEQLRFNEGLEALASLPDGRMLVFSEGRNDGTAPMFLISLTGEVTESRLVIAGPHLVTGADIGPDGRLYLVLRDYSLIFGLSIRILRFSLGPDGFPLPGSAETLAAFEDPSGIDNMEGISLERNPQGGIWLWLISDNNFRPSQRNLLMRFDVLE